MAGISPFSPRQAAHAGRLYEPNRMLTSGRRATQGQLGLGLGRDCEFGARGQINCVRRCVIKNRLASADLVPGLPASLRRDDSGQHYGAKLFGSLGDSNGLSRRQLVDGKRDVTPIGRFTGYMDKLLTSPIRID